MKLAFIGYRKQERYSIGSPKDEDKVLLDLLSAKGLNIEQVIWNDPSVDWRQYDKAIIKSPWDYHEQFADFTAWLDKMEKLGIELMNSYGIIRWNSDKHYLKEIEDSGLPVIPSLFLEKNTEPELSGFFTELRARKLFVKPCISASAKNTMVVTEETLAERREQLHKLLREDSFIVQPFVEEISDGELSLVFLGNRYSHSVLKLPKSGDFRVQHFHGGTIRLYEPDAELISDAKKYADRYASDCLYARVDGVMIKGKFYLMELELIEPYLFLDTSEGAYQRYYEALMRILNTEK